MINVKKNDKQKHKKRYIFFNDDINYFFINSHLIYLIKQKRSKKNNKKAID